MSRSKRLEGDADIALFGSSYIVLPYRGRGLAPALYAERLQWADGQTATGLWYRIDLAAFAPR